MIISKYKALVFMALVVIFNTATAFTENYKIVVRSDSPVTAIKANELRKIFLGNKLYWDNGSRILTARLKGDDDGSLDNFYDTIIKMPANKYLTYWRSKLFSGRGIPPVRKNSMIELVNYLGVSASAIAVIPHSTKISSSTIREVRVLKD